MIKNGKGITGGRESPKEEQKVINMKKERVQEDGKMQKGRIVIERLKGGILDNEDKEA